MPAELFVALSGAVASFLSGLLGIGGGIVLAPLLLYGAPLVGAEAVPVKIVTGLTIIQALSASLLGLARHRGYGNVSHRLVMVMGPSGATAALAGALLSGLAPDRLLLGVFAAFALAGAAALFMPLRSQDAGAADLQADMRVAAGMAIVVGFFGGMVGIGAIAFLIAGLVYVLRVPPRIAIGTSLGVGFFAALATLVGKAATAQIDPPLAGLVLVAALVASPAGAWLSQRTPPRTLMLMLAVLVALSGLRMAFEAITGI